MQYESGDKVLLRSDLASEFRGQIITVKQCFNTTLTAEEMPPNLFVWLSWVECKVSPENELVEMLRAKVKHNTGY